MAKFKYNTMLDVAFSVEHSFPDAEALLDSAQGRQMVFAALLKRIAFLVEEPNEAAEAFGICDTYDIPKENV